jgi:drug/metabolite transporter (DMT)-like permease
VTRDDRDLRAAAAAAVTVVLWASAFVAIRIALPGIGAGALSLTRLVVAAVVLLMLARVLRVRRPPRAALGRIAVAGAAGMAAYQLLLNSGERTVDAGTASLLVNTAPLFAAVLARVVLGERLTRRAVTGMVAGFAGAAGMVLGTGHGLSLQRGALLVLGAAVAQAAFFVVQKPLLRQYTAAEVTCWAMVTGCLMLVPLAPATTTAWRAVPDGALPVTAAAVGFLAVGASALGFTTWAYAQARMTVAGAAATLYAVPPVAVGVGWLLLDEVPSVLTLVGGVVALTGVALSRTASARPPGTAPARPPGRNDVSAQEAVENDVSARGCGQLRR